jgi:hypothetical protein
MFALLRLHLRQRRRDHTTEEIEKYPPGGRPHGHREARPYLEPQAIERGWYPLFPIRLGE